MNKRAAKINFRSGKARIRMAEDCNMCCHKLGSPVLTAVVVAVCTEYCSLSKVDNVPPKLPHPPARLNGVTGQKTTIWYDSAVLEIQCCFGTRKYSTTIRNS
jgi:hypothetical protein